MHLQTVQKARGCAQILCSISPFNNLFHAIIHISGIPSEFALLSEEPLSPPAGWKGAQACVGAGEGRGGFGSKHQVYSHHVDADAAHDVRRPLHLGHQQRLLQPQRGACLVQPRRVRITHTEFSCNVLMDFI